MVPDVRRGGFCPPTAQYAMRQGRRAAQNILATIHGKNPQPFVFGGLGQLAVVGRHCGVAQIMGVKMAGFFAWWLWRSVYWMKLPGLRCKVRVGIDWALDLLFPRDITKLAMQRTEKLRRAHYRAGDTIFRQGDIGDRFFIIESGEVEVLVDQNDQPPKRLATRGAGEYFGEVALLKRVPRMATVRCMTAVDVVTFTQQDFQMLVGSYTAFRRNLERDIEDRLRELPDSAAKTVRDVLAAPEPGSG